MLCRICGSSSVRRDCAGVFPRTGVQQHQDGIQAKIPHPAGAMLSRFQQEVNLDPLVCTFCRRPFGIFLSPCLTASRWRVVKARILRERYMKDRAILRIRTWFCTNALLRAIRASSYARAPELKPLPCLFRTIAVHAFAGRAYRRTIGIGMETVLGNRRSFSGTARIQINERGDAHLLAIPVKRHGVVCRVEQELRHMERRPEKHAEQEECIDECHGIMAGSWDKKREDWKVIRGIRCRKQIQIIAIEIEGSGRIPADIAIGLGIMPVAIAMLDTFCFAGTDAVLPLACAGADRCAIASERKSIRRNQSFLARPLQEQREYCSQWPVRDGLRERIALPVI